MYWPGVLLQHMHATIAELFGKYLLAEHEYTETDSSSDSLVFSKHSQSAYDKLIPAVLRSFAIPAWTAPIERVFIWWSSSSSKGTHECQISFCQNWCFWSRHTTLFESDEQWTVNRLKDTFLLAYMCVTCRSNIADEHASSSTVHVQLVCYW